MKFTCERSVLLKEISIAQEIIATKNAISILSNIYLEAENDSLKIKATDLKVNFETQVPVTVLEPGSTTVFGEDFSGLISSFPDGDEIEFEKKDGESIFKMTQGKKWYSLKCIDSEKFPEFSVSNAEFFEISIKDFKEMVQQTVFAVSDDETRYFMNGVFFEKTIDEQNGAKLVMVATDGRRLAYISKAVEGGIKDFSGVIIPPKILNLIIKRAGDEGLISLSVTDKTIYIQFGSYKLSSVLIEGQFPNYKRVIPEKQSYSFTVNRLEMLDTLRRVSQIVEKKSHRVYLGISPGMISVYSEEGEKGLGKEDFPCKYEGEEVSIALNYRYIEEPFKVISGEEICVNFTEPTKAITITPVPEQDFFHIIMPMQLD